MIEENHSEETAIKLKSNKVTIEWSRKEHPEESIMCSEILKQEK